MRAPCVPQRVRTRREIPKRAKGRAAGTMKAAAQAHYFGALDAFGDDELAVGIELAEKHAAADGAPTCTKEALTYRSAPWRPQP